MTNIEIAQLISREIGPRPIPFQDVRTIALEIYHNLGGENEEDFEDIFEILLSIIPLTNLIDDNSTVTNKTWSSSKISTELDTSVSDLNNRIETVEGELEDLDEFTCGTIEPTTTNFVEDTSYTIHEALQRTANLFGGIQGEIDDINDLIPNQATEQNQLADKDFVNSTVATNAANFRGNWADWSNVPTDASLYPEDYVGNRTPTNNDYMVVQDASDYVNSSSFVHQLTVVNLHPTKSITIGVTNEYGEYQEYQFNDGFLGTWKSISNEYSLKYTAGAPGTWFIKTNKPEDTYIIKDGVAYADANNGIVLVRTNASTEPVIIGIQSQVGQYQGSWRFIYVGTWATNGKNGWNPQYRIGSSFTAAQQAAIDSGITSTKVATYDGYGTAITALQTDKLDKNYTANKIYGTNSLGSQAVYELGNGLAFENGTLAAVYPTVTIDEVVSLLENNDAKEYIKLFDTPEDGDGYEIIDIPFSALVKSTGQEFVYNEEDGKLVNDNGVLRLYIPSNTIVYFSNDTQVEYDNPVLEANTLQNLSSDTLRKIEVGEIVTEIQRGAMLNVNYVEEITIPKTVTIMGSGTSSNYVIETVLIQNSTPVITIEKLYNTYSNVFATLANSKFIVKILSVDEECFSDDYNVDIMFKHGTTGSKTTKLTYDVYTDNETVYNQLNAAQDTVTIYNLYHLDETEWV